MNTFWIAIAYLFVGATLGVVAMSLAAMAKGGADGARNSTRR